MNGFVGFMYFIEIDELFLKNQEPKKITGPLQLKGVLFCDLWGKRQTETSSTEKFTNLEVFSELLKYHQKGLRNS